MEIKLYMAPASVASGAKNHIIDGPPCSSLLNDNETVASGGASKYSGDTIDHVLTAKSPTRSASTSSTQSLFVSEDEVKSRIMLIKLSFLRLSVASYRRALVLWKFCPLHLLKSQYPIRTQQESRLVKIG